MLNRQDFIRLRGRSYLRAETRSGVQARPCPSGLHGGNSLLKEGTEKRDFRGR
jgi:hypothetical protein